MAMRWAERALGMARRLGAILGGVWGYCGVLAVVAYAVWRLAPVAYQSLQYHLTALQWAALGVHVAYMLYAEGYKGFQRAFAPRVVARSLYLRRHPTPTRIILAPFFVAGFFHAPRRRIVANCALTGMIFCFVALVRLLEQPWRGIVDAGVVAGLVWGLAAMLYFMAQAITRTLDGRGYAYPPEVPAPDDAKKRGEI